jgi:hypothetical protein
MDEQSASIAIFGHDMAPLAIERCSASLDMCAGKSPRGSAPVAVRKAVGEGFNVRAAAISGFQLPGSEALVSVRVTLASCELSKVDIRTDSESEAGTECASLTVGGFAAAKRLARALRAAADTVDMLAQDISDGAVTAAVANARRVQTIRPPPILPVAAILPAVALVRPKEKTRTSAQRAQAAARAREWRARRKAERLGLVVPTITKK